MTAKHWNKLKYGDVTVDGPGGKSTTGYCQGKLKENTIRNNVVVPKRHVTF